MEFSDSFVRSITQQELKISVHVTDYKAGDMDNLTPIEEREEDLRKGVGVVSQCTRISCSCILGEYLKEQQSLLKCT